MTYGWMLLVVAVVGGAIFSVAQSESLESTSGFSGGDVQVDDFGVTSGDELELILRNADSNGVTVNSVNVSDGDSFTEWIGGESISVGDTGSVSLANVTEGDGANSLDVTVNYDSGGLSDLQVEGSISGNMEIISDSTVSAGNGGGDGGDGGDGGEITVEIDEQESTLAVEEGEEFSVVVDIVNTGETELTQDLEAEVDGELQDDIEDVTLSAGDSDTETLTFDAEAEFDGQDVDVSSDDDTDNAELSVAEVGEFTVDIDEGESELNVEEGEDFSVVVDIENTGDTELTQDLTAEVDGEQRAIEEDVTLAGGADEKRTLTFTAESGDFGQTVEVSSNDDSDAAELEEEVVSLVLSEDSSNLFEFGELQRVPEDENGDPLPGFEEAAVGDDVSEFDLENADASNVEDMSRMFQSADSFNQDISGWDTSNVEDIDHMFNGANSFNQDISSWDTSSVTIMERMFQFADSFNQDISSWCVEQISSEPFDFDNGAGFEGEDEKQPNWGEPC